MQGSITLSEYERWIEFYRLNPFDDLHRFHRPAVLIAKSMAGGDERVMLDWLQPPPVTGHTDADLDLFRAGGVQPPPRRST